MEPITFKEANLIAIKNTIKGFQPENKFKNFSAISDIINEATGMVPDQAIPVLQQLSASYSRTSMSLRVAFADACAILSKFVVKSYRVMERGMNKNDLDVLMEFKNQLTGDIINKFDSFVNTSREQLNEVQQIVFGKAKGARGTNLLNNKTQLENELVRRSKPLADQLSESGRIQGQIDSLLYEQQIVQKGLEDSKAGKEEAKKELAKLKAQIPDYEAQIQSHRDTHSEERGRFWIFTWKIRDIHKNNGEKIARENLDRLLERVRSLQRMVDNWSDAELNTRVAAARAQLPKYKNEKTSSDTLYEKLKGYYDEAERNFNATINEINKIYQLAGTVDIQSMHMIDKIARAIQSGEQSFSAAYDTVRNYLKTIDVDKDLLVNSVIAALRFMHMTDEYLGASKIQSVKDVLGFE